jgi:hypothetical protein
MNNVLSKERSMTAKKKNGNYYFKSIENRLKIVKSMVICDFTLSTPLVLCVDFFFFFYAIFFSFVMKELHTVQA